MQQRGTGLLLWARWAEDIDRLLHVRGPAATAPQQHAGKQHASSVAFTAAVQFCVDRYEHAASVHNFI